MQRTPIAAVLAGVLVWALAAPLARAQFDALAWQLEQPLYGGGSTTVQGDSLVVDIWTICGCGYADDGWGDTTVPYSGIYSFDVAAQSQGCSGCAGGFCDEVHIFAQADENPCAAYLFPWGCTADAFVELNDGVAWWWTDGVITYNGSMSVLASAGETLRIGAITGGWSLECQLKATFSNLVYTPALGSDVGSLPAASGGTQNLTLTTSGEHAGQLYLLLGSLSGTSPVLPVGAVELPLAWDAYLLYTLGNPNTPGLQNTLGGLDAQGGAAASLSLPPLKPAHAGLVLQHAFLVFDALGQAVFASNPRSLQIS